MAEALEELLVQVRSCTRCAAVLPLGPRPVLQAHRRARILVVGQAPGKAVHRTGLPFNDPSGDRLRDWMGVDRSVFYDATRIALVPMGLCYPGTGPSGDAPPRPECAATWRARLLAAMPEIEFTLLLGRYAHDWHLGRQGASLAQTVRDWRRFWPAVVPMPHPSPRNNLWLRRNPWFESEVLPQMRERLAAILRDGSQPDGCCDAKAAPAFCAERA